MKIVTPILRKGVFSIFATSRQASFAPRASLSPPLILLLDSFELYKKQLQLNGEIYETVQPGKIFKLSKEELDKVFGPHKGIEPKKKGKGVKRNVVLWRLARLLGL